MKLVRLIYASHLVAPLAKTDAQQILSASLRRNNGLGVTGYLCVSATHALQCLEGPRDAVNTVYNLVAADPRHTNVTLLRYVEAWRRLFPVWDMGFTSDLATAAPESARWHDDSGFNPYLVDSDLIENVIEALCESAEKVELRV
ncbi:MAG TPA: BLUF domain-containing protein [Casimicrobium sp.]|nr:BLUF domain-containing protein [Casimicrobium sp.]